MWDGRKKLFWDSNTKTLFKWWPWVDLDLFYGKVKFDPLQCRSLNEKKKAEIVHFSVAIGNAVNFNPYEC